MGVGSDVYHAPVAPVVPVADTTVAHLVGSIGNAGLAAFTQRAIAAQRAQLETEQMVQQAALQTDAHAIQRENLQKDYDLGLKRVDAEKYASDLRYQAESDKIDAEKPLWAAEAENYSARAKAESSIKGVLAKRTAMNSATLADFQTQLTKYGLDDPNPSDPVQYYANAQKLKDEFRFATGIPAITNGLKQVDLVTQQHTIPLPTIIRGEDPDGKPIERTEVRKVPVGEVVKNLLDPKTQDAMWGQLETAGYVRHTAAPVKKGEPAVTSSDLDPEKAGELRSLLPKSLKADFARSKNRVPMNAEPDLPVQEQPTFQPTEVDTKKAQAKRAIALGANRDDVAAKLQGQGIDASDL